MKKSSSPVVISGMHRSGTSLVTSFLAAMGLDVGVDLVPADANNRKGYFEDESFLELNRRVLGECCDDGDGGHADWGWTESESFNFAQLDPQRLEVYRAAGQELLENNEAKKGLWGFKDPRSTLLLDLWDSLLDDARFVMVYRYPWDVADSMQRLSADVFLRRPDYAPKIWDFYNHHLLEFYRRHADRCVLISTNALLEDPKPFLGLIRDKLGLGLEVASLNSIYEGELLSSMLANDPLIKLFAATSPSSVDLLQQLDAAADLPSSRSWVGAVKEPLKAFDPGQLVAALDSEASPRMNSPTEVVKARVGVVIPCRNHGQFLLEAIASAERSLSEPYELVIIDDGSDQPRTIEILATLRAGGYRVEHQEHSGLSAARNHGFRLMETSYVIPLDADNRLRSGPFYTEAFAALEADPELGVVYGNREEFGLRTGRRVTAAFNLQQTLKGNYIDACAVLRREMWLDVGGYDEELPAWEDWEMWIRVSGQGWKFHHLDRLAFDYRVRPDSLVTRTEQPEVLRKILDRVVTRHRRVFEQHLTDQLGEAMGKWPFLLELERDSRRSFSGSSAPSPAPGAAAVSAQPVVSSGSHAEYAAGLAHARLEASEARHEAERATWRLEHARASAQHFEESASQLCESLSARDEVVRAQQLSLAELRESLSFAQRMAENVERNCRDLRIELTERDASSVAKDAAMANELTRRDGERDRLTEELQGLERAYQQALSELTEVREQLAIGEERRLELERVRVEMEGSRAFNLVQWWWRLAARLRPSASSSSAGLKGLEKPKRVEDGAIGG